MVAFLYGWVRSEAIQLAEKRVCKVLGKEWVIFIIYSLYPFFTHFLPILLRKGKKGVERRKAKNGKMLGRLKNEEVRRGAGFTN